MPALKGEVQIVGLTQLITDARAVGATGADRLVKAALVNSMTEIQKQARERAPHRTGTLQRSILPELHYPYAIVAVNEKYGLYLEEGTGPYDIVPKNKKALFWKGAAHPYRRVHHPGLKARPFFWPGVEASKSFIDNQFVIVITKLVDAIAGKAKV